MSVNVGDRVIVRAWWGARLPTKCIVTHVYKDSKFVTVKPIEGTNPHSRFVSLEDIIERFDAPKDQTP